MTDKKFADEEIIHSLEVIATTHNCNECKIRNCKWGTCNCEKIAANAALDLISRQKAHNEMLQIIIFKKEDTMQIIAEEKQQLADEVHLLKYEIERLKGSIILNNIMEIQRIRDAKAEACKEFAGNIKEKCGLFTPLGVNWIEETKVVRVSDIDKILKEMVGEK